MQNQTETNRFEALKERHTHLPKECMMHGFSIFSELKCSARRAMPLCHRQIEYFKIRVSAMNDYSAINVLAASLLLDVSMYGFQQTMWLWVP